MDLKITHEIDNNVFSTSISVSELGTDQLTSEQEAELLKDFPSFIAYRNLTFTKNIKIVGSVPEVTTDEVGTGVISVSLPTLSNKEIKIDEDFAATYRIDTGKILTSAIDADVLTTKELVAQAYCAIFDKVLVDAISEKMTEIRGKAPGFVSEITINV